jgi:hypothetical protein
MQIIDAVLLSHESGPFYRDSMRIYEPVVEKFGYTLEDLRRTFLKYTAGNNTLQSVLNQVTKKIMDEKSIYQGPARIEKLSENMNVGADSVVIVSKTVNRQNIEVRLSEQGVYDISASYFFYNNDSTKNPKISVRLESRAYKDSIIEKHEISLVKDTVFTDYSLQVKFDNPEFNILKVYWIDFEQKLEPSKPETAISLPVQSAKTRLAGTRKKANLKIKPDTTIRQHLVIKRKSVKYNFEESDTAKLKEKDEFIGPLPSDFLSKNNTTDSVTSKTVERVIAIKRKDSIIYEQ